MTAHVEETAQGSLLGLTPRGWFHIERLRLNRPLLVEMRRLRRVAQVQRADLARARDAEARLQQENRSLQGEIARLRATIVELLRRGER